MLDLSIIIPTFKPGKYLHECLASLANQTLDKSLYEIILVLNGPREPYIYELSKYSEQYANVVLLYTKIAGVSNARNMGLDVAGGEYICFVDDDDIVSSNYLFSLLRKAQKTNLVVANVKNFTEQISQSFDDYVSFAFQKMKKNNRSNIFWKRSFLSNACCKMIPARLIENFRFNPNFKIGEDALFMFAISRNIKNIELADDAIYYRRCRIGSASRVKKTLFFKIKNSVLQILEYTKIYIHNPLKYNFLLYLSRIAASLLHILK